MRKGHAFIQPTRLLALISALLVLGVDRDAAAQAEEPETAEEKPSQRVTEAQRRFAEGAQAYRNGEFERARLAFEQAYALEPLPVLLINLGQAEYRTGHYVECARHLSAALREANMREAERDTATRTLEQAEARVGRILVKTNVEEATVHLDGASIGDTPMLYVWHVEPGEHRLRVDKKGYEPQATTFGISRGKLKEFEVTLLPKREDAASSKDGSATSSWRHPDPKILIIGASVAALGLGTGTFFLISSKTKRDEQDEEIDRLDALYNTPEREPMLATSALCGPESDAADSLNCNRIAALGKNADDHQLLGMVALGTGAAFGIATLTYWLWPRDDASKSKGSASAVDLQRLDIAPLYSPGFAGLSVSGSL